MISLILIYFFPIFIHGNMEISDTDSNLNSNTDISRCPGWDPVNALNRACRICELSNRLTWQIISQHVIDCYCDYCASSILGKCPGWEKMKEDYFRYGDRAGMEICAKLSSGLGLLILDDNMEKCYCRVSKYRNYQFTEIDENKIIRTLSADTAIKSRIRDDKLIIDRSFQDSRVDK